MRSYMFRGRRLEDNQWVYGDLRRLPAGAACIVSRRHGYTKSDDVYPDTVGQSLEREDKDGIALYEGDRVHTLILHNDVKADATWLTGTICWDKDGCDYNIISDSGDFLAAFGTNNTVYAVADELPQIQGLRRTS